MDSVYENDVCMARVTPAPHPVPISVLFSRVLA